MSISKPSELPLELIEKIIDEAFHAQYSTRADKRSERMIVDPQTLSSLARVSHVFRQRINSHRFSIVSFPRKNFKASLPYIHGFLDLLRSDVWEAPSMGLARHVRKLVLILGERDERGDIIPHRAIDDRTYTTIMNSVFRGGDNYQNSLSHGDYTLELWGSTGGHVLSWDVMSADFTSTIERLLDSCVATLGLKWLSDVPPTLTKRRHVKRLSTYLTFFQLTLEQILALERISDFPALEPWDHLESLDIDSPHFFGPGAVDPEVVPMLKALTVTFEDENSLMAESLIFERPWNILEDLMLNFDNDHLEPRFRVDYRNFPNLKCLTINLLLVHYYHSSINTPAINENAHQILNLLGPHLPPLARLEIGIYTHSNALSHTHRPSDILAQIDCASLDAVLVQYNPPAVATLALRLGLKLSPGPGEYVEWETFRQAGLAVVREAFPRLNAGPRRRVYDSEPAATWEDEERRLLYGGMFSVAYMAAAAEHTV